MAKLIVFLGRSTEGILRDSLDVFEVEYREILVISREGDQLQPQAGLECVPVSKFQPEAGQEYILVANGGTSAQLLPVVKRLVEVGATFQAWDLQREEMFRVW